MFERDLLPELFKGLVLRQALDGAMSHDLSFFERISV